MAQNREKKKFARKVQNEIKAIRRKIDQRYKYRKTLKNGKKIYMSVNREKLGLLNIYLQKVWEDVRKNHKRQKICHGIKIREPGKKRRMNERLNEYFNIQLPMIK